jgi:sec-independent protein translocase protein TatA
MGIGFTEILIIALVMMLLFGASRLPTIGRDLGTGIRALKEGLSGIDGSRRDRAPTKPAEANAARRARAQRARRERA